MQLEVLQENGKLISARIILALVKSIVDQVLLVLWGALGFQSAGMVVYLL